MNLLSLLLGLRFAARVVSLHVPERQLGSKSNVNIAIELQAHAGERRYPSARTNKELLRSEARARLEEHTFDSLDDQELATLKSHDADKKVHPDVAVGGVCQKTDGLQMDGGVNVLAIEDLSECAGNGVKSLGIFDQASFNNPLQACSQKVASDPECSSKFTMEDLTMVCECVKKDLECELQNSDTTCVYQLIPPVCSNTSGITLTHGAGATSTVTAVFPAGFESDCSNKTFLGNFTGGFKKCADAVAKHSGCGHKFEFHRTRFSCFCLNNGTTCTSEDSNDFCLYQLTNSA